MIEYMSDFKDLRALANINISNCGRIKSLPLASVTKEYFKKLHIDLNYPLLIKGAVAEWPATKKWSDGFLKSTLKKTDLSFFRSMNLNDAEYMRSTVQSIKGDEYIKLRQNSEEEILSAPHLVLDKEWLSYNGDLYKIGLESMIKDTKPFPFLDGVKPGVSSPFYRLYLYKNAGTGWHEHPNDEYIMCQIKGSKRVAMFASTKIKDDYPSFFNDMQKNDYLFVEDYFSKVEKNILVADVEEGDGLYIPPHWFHGVDTLDKSPGTTLVFSWRPPLHKLGNFRYPSIKRILAYVFKNGSRKMALGYLAMTLASNFISLMKFTASLFKKNDGGVKFGKY